MLEEKKKGMKIVHKQLVLFVETNKRCCCASFCWAHGELDIIATMVLRMFVCLSVRIFLDQNFYIYAWISK